MPIGQTTTDLLIWKETIAKEDRISDSAREKFFDRDTASWVDREANSKLNPHAKPMKAPAEGEYADPYAVDPLAPPFPTTKSR
eukprot:CAMPEP_0183793168 /NCGR_PEP_ID=MMETSP0803_2-20130417/3043_1 /TAXON_ID=195967 /ORGANISM="Crustomastix stigmata, Strain CCMP3273" /LENGTH=82 /DNA_ID=CAMNT_0026037541 /DNA_START=56 /DNA_END=301 /DNA_ORIENTATION=-